MERQLVNLRLLCRNHSSHFEKAKPAFEEGAGNDELEVDESRREKIRDDDEKGSIDHTSKIEDV